MRAHYLLYPAMIMLAGCGADDRAVEMEKPAAAETQADEAGGVIPEHQLEALEKAEEVEGQLQEAAEKRADPS